MNNLEKNLEYLIVSFFALNSLNAVPDIFKYMSSMTENMLLICSGTAMITILMLYISVFMIKYAIIPLNIMVGKQLNKIV